MKYALALILAIASPLAFAVGQMPSIRQIIWDVVVVLAVLVCFGILRHLVNAAPFIDDTWKPIIQWGLLLVVALIVIYIILGFVGL